MQINTSQAKGRVLDRRSEQFVVSLLRQVSVVSAGNYIWASLYIRSTEGLPLVRRKLYLGQSTNRRVAHSAVIGSASRAKLLNGPERIELIESWLKLCTAISCK